LVHHADRKKGAAAAQAGRRVHPAARGLEHPQGRARVARLEIAVEGVDQQHDIRIRRFHTVECVRSPLGQIALCGKPKAALED